MGSWRVHASMRPRIHASARPHDGSTRGRWMLCTHPPFLGLHACNKMGSTPVLPRKIRQNQQKNNFFLRGDFRPFPNKNVQFWDHFYPALFPKDSESLKNLDIRLWEVGAKCVSKYTTRKGTDRYIDIYMDIATTRSNRPSGPIRWKERCFLVLNWRFWNFKHL